MKLVIDFNSFLLLKYTISELFEYKYDFEKLLIKLGKIHVSENEKAYLESNLYALGEYYENIYKNYENEYIYFTRKHKDKLEYYKKNKYSIIKDNNIFYVNDINNKFKNNKSLLKYIDNYNNDILNYKKIYNEIIKILK